MNKLDYFAKTLNKLSNKHLFLFFAFSVILYSWQVIVTNKVGSDAIVQMGLAINFLDGYGFSMLSADRIGDIEKTPNFHWPYLYRLLSVPFLLLTGNNLKLTYFILLISSYTLFLASITFFINENFKKKRTLILALIYLLSAITFSPIKYMADIDLLTLGIALFSVTFFIRFFQCGNQYKDVLLFFLLLALLPLARYAYIPMTLGFIGFYIVLAGMRKNGLRKSQISLAILPLLSITFTVLNASFLARSARIAGMGDTLQATMEQTVPFIKLFYAPIFNSFYPDYIIVSFLQRFTDLYSAYIVLMLVVFAVISIVIMGGLGLYFLKNTGGIKDFFKNEKLAETTLWAMMLAHLVFYIFLYRNFNHSYEKVMSGVFIYENLAVVNRYFAPIHAGAFLLAIKYIVEYNSRFFKLIVFSSLLFGFVHFVYLRTMVYHPYDRSYNVGIASLPVNSYNDITKIGTIIKKEKKNHTIYFINQVTGTEENHRQGKPILFALGHGAIILAGNTDLSDADDKKDIHILLATATGNAPDHAENWELLYRGVAYDLYKLTP